LTRITITFVDVRLTTSTCKRYTKCTRRDN